MRKAARWFGIAALLIVADYASKWLVLARIAPGERIEVTGFFNLVLVFNKGAAFSFLSAASGWQTPLFLAIAVAAAVVIAVLLVRPTPSPAYRAALALILGGALGNAVDRLRFGQVVDFLDFHYLGWHWPAFNVADAAITVGALLLVAESFMHRDKGGSVHG